MIEKKKKEKKKVENEKKKNKKSTMDLVRLKLIPKDTKVDLCAYISSMQRPLKYFGSYPFLKLLTLFC